MDDGHVVSIYVRRTQNWNSHHMLFKHQASQGFHTMLHSHKFVPKDRSLNCRLFLGFPHYQGTIEEDEGNRSLPLWTLLAVLWQMCHVWITAWNVTGSVLVTGRPSYLKQKSTIFHVFRHAYSCSNMLATPSGRLVGLSRQNQTMFHMALTRFYQCLRLCSCGTKPQRSENHHFVMTSSWKPQCHHDIIMRTPRITGKLKFSCPRGPQLKYPFFELGIKHRP